MSNTQVLPPQLFDDDWARTRESDPIESHMAADSITVEGLRASQAHVLNDLTLYGKSAAWQIEERAGHWSPSRIRTALKELEESGCVVRHRLEGVTPSGRACAMFEAVQS